MQYTAVYMIVVCVDNYMQMSCTTQYGLQSMDYVLQSMDCVLQSR